jgi:hypothetical protein
MSCNLNRRAALKSMLFTGPALRASTERERPATYSFFVFSLLKPKRLYVSGLGEARPRYSIRETHLILEPGTPLVIDPRQTPTRLCAPGGGPVSFVLEIPHVIRRTYYGLLEITSLDDTLLPVIRMPRETAVSSIVAAELPSARAPLDALAAQAVVARSFLAGTRTARHPNSQFCDTTHCQFLRSPAPVRSAADIAQSITRSVVLMSDRGIVPALYSASCGGRTEAGERDGFLYESAECDVCRRANRARGGHGWGLCQEGAIGLAQLGWSWESILRHYYPAARLLV